MGVNSYLSRDNFVLYTGRYEAVASGLVDLPGLYLNVDPRNKFEEVYKLCKQLINQGYVTWLLK